MEREKERREPAGESQSPNRNDSDGVSESDSEHKRQEKTLKVICFIKVIKHGEDTLTNKVITAGRVEHDARLGRVVQVKTRGGGNPLI